MSTSTRPPRRPVRKVSPAATPTPADWPAWQQHLASRAPVTFPGQWFQADALAPLLWGLPMETKTGPVSALVAQLTNFLKSQTQTAATIAQLTLWRAMHGEVADRLELAIGALAWSHVLPKLASVLSTESWTGLLSDLEKLVADAAGINPEEDPLAHQLFAVELPLTLAHVLPELESCQALVRPARKLLSWGAEELTDGEGLPKGRHIPTMKPLLACWTRTIAMCRATVDHNVDEDAQLQFEWLLRQNLRWMRDDGSFTFTPISKDASMRTLVDAALTLIDDKDDHTLAKAAFIGVKLKDKPEKKKAKSELVEPFVYSEWSEAGVLRGNWLLGSPRLAVTFDERRVQCELSAYGQVLLSGIWMPEVSIDGWTWKPENNWEEVCWHTDDDVVYLEIETKLNAGWKIQRQMLLARKDRFVLLADAVLGEEDAKLEYRGTLPLAPGVRFLPADETREGFLANKRAQALVLPLALPEWRSQGGGELQTTDALWQYSLSHQGKRLFAPLFIDLDPQRIRKECTWRQLTVAQQLEIQPRDIAVAFRAQIGKEQWSVYRSLGPKGNRTYLGHNVVTEFQVARFNAQGNGEVLLEVE